MSENNKHPETENDAPAQVQKQIVSPSRRRLIKLGTVAVPVVATLTSRPALAWHCQSPSAWGSELLNPTTSLKTNAGHQTYPDETWYISNWANNMARNASGFTTSKPWSYLKSKFPSIYDTTTTSMQNGKNYFDYTKVTIEKLLTTIPQLNAAGAIPTATVKSVLTNGSALQKSVIVAQLNYILLSPNATNQIEMCLPFTDLTNMAAGTFSPSGSGVLWDSQKVIDFLYKNWIAR